MSDKKDDSANQTENFEEPNPKRAKIDRVETAACGTELCGNVDEEDISTLQDIEQDLADMDYQNDAARHLLAAQDVNNCTYAQGYMPRQALFSCLTCVPAGDSGICYGCSENCHEGHEVIELHTKRRFKCDCGNDLFKNKCKLFEGKSGVNHRNLYGHNFKNEYCKCNRPYPDIEGDHSLPRIMYQCIFCEDWFHANHIDLDTSKIENVDDDNQYEIACITCCQKFAFLDKFCDNREYDGEVKCSEEKRKEGFIPSTLVLNKNWRDRLCSCSTCEDLYDKHGCDWIHDPDDTLEKYEKEAEERMKEEDESDKAELDNFIRSHDPNVVTSVMTEMDRIKERMKLYMTSLPKDTIITKEHIKNFFDNMTKEREEELSRKVDRGDGLGPSNDYSHGEY